MSADSSLTVTLYRDRWWFAGVLAWALLAAAASLAWWLALHAAGGSPWLSSLPVLACLHAAWLVRHEWRAPAAVLRWDGLAWSLGRGEDVQAGQVGIALDFDRWLLLRMNIDAQPALGWRRLLPSAGTWLAVCESGLPRGTWHALRCALVRSAGAPGCTQARIPEGAAWGSVR